MNETTSTPDADGTPGTNAPGYAFQDELHEAKVQAKHAARATLLAMRSALDFALSKLEDDVRSSGEGRDLAGKHSDSQDEVGNV